MRAGTKQRRVWLFVLGFVFFAAFLAVMLNFFLGEREPAYEGRTLTSWLVQAEITQGFENPDKFQEATTAIVHIGTNGIPTLLRMVRKKDWPFQDHWNDWVQKRNLRRWYIRDATRYRTLAVKGFTILGPQAAPAIPELIKLLEHKDAGVRLAAAQSLTVLAACEKDAIKEAIPSLVRHLRDPDLNVQFGAVAALGQLRVEPKIVVPALVDVLKTHHPGGVPYVTCEALGEYGTDALSAVEVLQKYASDSNSNLRLEASRALYKITNSAPNPH